MQLPIAAIRALAPTIALAALVAAPSFAAGLAADFPSPVASDAGPARVAVVEGDFLGPNGESMRPQMRRHFAAMCEALEAAGVPYTTTSDTRVVKEGLSGVRLAILPYNRAVSPIELQRLLAFVRGGGKLIVCFLGPPDLLAAICVRADAIVKSSGTGQFAGIALQGSILPGLPPAFTQETTWVRRAAPLAGARALGSWQSADGKHSGIPGAIISQTGAYLSCALLPSGDLESQASFIRAICGFLIPAIWRDAIPLTPDDIRPLGNYQSLGHLQRALLDRGKAGEDISRCMGALNGVVQTLKLARGAADATDYLRAARFADQARAAARTVYWMSYPSKNGEMRGVWACNSASPSWDAAMKSLRGANINAVFPYVCSSGVAWYDSRYLPRASQTDYLALAVQAGRKYGVPVHARTLGLYAMCAPSAFIDRLREQGRLMVSPSGKTKNWLCPVNPANRRLIRQLAVEIVSRYPVDGFQIDYMRYPGEQYCFCPLCRKAFQEYVGATISNLPEAVKKGPLRDKFLDWRRKQVTDLVREIGNDILAVRPDVIISAAVFINWEDHRNGFAQDWKKWVDWGLVDMVCPMNYTPSNDRFTLYTQRQVKWVGKQVPLCPGIGVNADNMTFPGPQGLLDQITIARNMDTDGWVIFNYYDGLVSDYLPYLKLGATSAPSTFNPFRRAIMPPTGG